MTVDASGSSRPAAAPAAGTRDPGHPTTEGHEGVVIGAFARAFGERERKPQDIPDFERLWNDRSPDTDFTAMGCGTFRTMTRPIEEYVREAVRATLRTGSVPADRVDRIVFATSDARLGSLGPDFAARVLDGLGLVHCVPQVISFQQCCGSLTALAQGWAELRDPAVRNVVVVSLDFTPDDADRVRPFALFSDAVVSCLITREAALDGTGPVRLLSSAVGLDHAGLLGQDSFLSRQKVARAAYARVLGEGRRLDDVTKVFPTNLYAPVTLFNTTMAGVDRDRLHFTDTLAAYGHCGNSDWMINLVDYHRAVGIRAGELYLAQSSAPGFFACGLLAGA